ncbi:hypothetical protein ANCCAN_05860 [Ancylostoma caninum]|uniref:G-protein coupled receptors family 1 profile domain-containing protein n=1 Tax=Ancylostoma caninum TaxID=29170 RepID=A0A368GUQ1_ANCCA|nr:hypothetical protein ANCCAN_05860 [Ancylostoma caninum]
MSLHVALYVLNVVLNTLIIALDILIIWAALASGEIRRNLVLHIIITAMVMDIVVYMNTILHDIPSFITNTDFSVAGLRYVSVLILCSQWFSQLLFLPVLSVIHFLAIFSPTKFRSIANKHVYGANIAIVMFGFLMTGNLQFCYLISLFCPGTC